MLNKRDLFDRKETVPAHEIGSLLRKVKKVTGIRDKMLAQGTGIAEAQLNRITAGGGGRTVRVQTIAPLKRVLVLIEKAEAVLTPEGVKTWLTKPNPYLNDVPPILCLRSDKELEKVLGLLEAIEHGFPA